MVFTFDKSKGLAIGASLVEDDKIELAKQLEAESGGKIVLPTDVVIADKFAEDAETKIVKSGEIPDGWLVCPDPDLDANQTSCSSPDCSSYPYLGHVTRFHSRQYHAADAGCACGSVDPVSAYHVHCMHTRTPSFASAAGVFPLCACVYFHAYTRSKVRTCMLSRPYC